MPRDADYRTLVGDPIEDLHAVPRQYIDALPVQVAWKSHRVADMTFEAADTWYAIEWDTENADESTPGIDYRDDSGTPDKTILVSEVTGILWMGGRIRPLWTGAAGGTDVITAVRVVTSDDEGVTWDEKRCLQQVDGHRRQLDEVGTERYNGTLAVEPGLWIRVEARVSNTDMELVGWPTFDNPVAASVALIGMATL